MMSKLDEKLITVVTAVYPHELTVIKGRLEAEGIPCFLKNEQIIQVAPFYSNTAGGVQLQVLESDLAKAQEIIALNESDYIDLSNEESQDNIIQPAEEVYGKRRCPNCGSGAILPHKLPVFLYAVSILLLGIPLLFIKRKYHCFTCEADFEKP